MISFDTLVSHGFGSAHVFVDPRSGLRSVIAIHNTRHGAAIGGSRFVSYLSDEAAWLDAIRLARGMAYKAAVAGLPLGGGKAVIMKPAGDFNREALFEAFGRAVDSLGGAYVTCEDSGTGTADMDTVRRVTRHALGSTAGSGDPSPLTAFGVRRGIEAAVAAKLGRDCVDGIHVAIQGVGHVGYYLAKELVERGARLTVADVNAENLDRAEKSPLKVSDAERDLIEALSTTTAQIQTRVARVLAVTPTQNAQRALLNAALAATQEQQIALLQSLAESGRRYGNKAEEKQIDRLRQALADAKGANADALAQAYGALNLGTDQVLKLILK